MELITNNYRLNTRKGFTLIEIMVAVSIFAMVMLIVVGALLALNNANKKAQALRAVVDNLNFAIEDMTRNIKTGAEYACGVTLNSSGTINSNGSSKANCKTADHRGIIVKGPKIMGTGYTKRQCIMYFFDGEEGQSGRIRYATINTNDSFGDDVCSVGNAAYAWGNITPTDLISPEVVIKDASFKVVNTDATQPYKQQPIVIININGEINLENYFKFPTPFAIQTTVSQRSSAQ